MRTLLVALVLAVAFLHSVASAEDQSPEKRRPVFRPTAGRVKRVTIPTQTAPAAAPSPSASSSPQPPGTSSPEPMTVSVAPSQPVAMPAAERRSKDPSGVEGQYRVDGATAVVQVRRLLGDIYHLTSTDGLEGVGILDGPTYRGVFRYTGAVDPKLKGVSGDHLIDWSAPTEARVRESQRGATRMTAWTWRRIETPGEKSPSTPPNVIVAAPGRRTPAFGEYVYVEELPEALTKVAPDYPEELKRAGIDGTVIVQALVLEDGTVGETRVQKTIPRLDDLAVAAVRQWRFKPALSKGAPVAVWVAVPVRFAP